MTKKIRYLTFKEFTSICSKHICVECPLMLTNHDICDCAYHFNRYTTKEKLKQFLDKEVEL